MVLHSGQKMPGHRNFTDDSLFNVTEVPHYVLPGYEEPLDGCCCTGAACFEATVLSGCATERAVGMLCATQHASPALLVNCAVCNSSRCAMFVGCQQHIDCSRPARQRLQSCCHSKRVQQPRLAAISRTAQALPCPSLQLLCCRDVPLQAPVLGLADTGALPPGPARHLAAARQAALSLHAAAALLTDCLVHQAVTAKPAFYKHIN